ncbi:MAG: hypothetical protein J07HQW2_00603 [Haloquadratum walsbyi J07HQW2]|uniref:Transposase n=1 Tax=Haloquadratum walsbyi J07HQW2 TaxID=1238425 RepID=U1MUW0_9EURY|nr:MAG: hypothetical protein J07HQW2_00603 [Haloquadratum walsbyi J07HQW2]
MGVNLGVVNFAHDSDGRSGELSCSTSESVSVSNASNVRCLARNANRTIGRTNDERRRVAETHIRMSNKKHDLKHKLAHFYTTENAAVFVENLNVKGKG